MFVAIHIRSDFSVFLGLSHINQNSALKPLHCTTFCLLQDSCVFPSLSSAIYFQCMIIIFIGPRSDHSLPLSVTDWLTTLLKIEWIDLNMQTMRTMPTMRTMQNMQNTKTRQTSTHHFILYSESHEDNLNHQEAKSEWTQNDKNEDTDNWTILEL